MMEERLRAQPLRFAALNFPALTCAAWLAIGCATPKPDAETNAIHITPMGDHRVIIRHDGYDAEWQFRFPEVVASREGTFMTSLRTPVEWRESGDGWRGYDWVGTEEYGRAAEQRMGGRQKMITGLKLSPRMKAGFDRIDLELTLENVADRTFHCVHSDGGCLQHRTERFIDETGSQTFMFTSAGLTPLDQTDRSIAIRSKYFVNPAWYEETGTKAFEFFWGRSMNRPAEALIASEASDGSGTIGIAWEHCLGLRQNSDTSHRCMHSSPLFGDLRPGEKLTRRGVIYFGDSVDAVVKRYRKERFPLHIGGPAD